MQSKHFLIAILFSMCLSFSAYSQHPAIKRLQNQGRFGLAVTVGHGQSFLMAPFWLTNKFVASPILGFKYLQNAELDFTLGLATRHYLGLDDLSYYFGFRVGSMYYRPYDQNEVNQDGRTDLFAGLAFGMEYYLARRFSVGLEVQGDFVQSDERSQRFNNPGGIGFIINPVLVLSFYF